jgi:hypothetical protein
MALKETEHPPRTLGEVALQPRYVIARFVHLQTILYVAHPANGCNAGYQSLNFSG